MKSRTVAGRRVGDATLCVITHKSHLVTAVLVNVICFSWPVCVGGGSVLMKKKDHICAACHRLCISEAPSWGKNSFLQERGPFLFFPHI